MDIDYLDEHIDTVNITVQKAGGVGPWAFLSYKLTVRCVAIQLNTTQVK